MVKIFCFQTATRFFIRSQFSRVQIEMSDELYDSLEEESTVSGSTLEYLKPSKSDWISHGRDSKSKKLNRQNSFNFVKFSKKENAVFFPSGKASSVNANQKNFLPVINNKNGVSGFQDIFKHSTDYETLTKKGLLLNRDGSFTKSETEELPFITREYKNLVFQKQKVYSQKNFKTRKSTSHSGKQTSERTLSSAGDGKKVFDGSLKEGKAKPAKISVDNENLTDSMKRILLLNQSQKRSVQSLDKSRPKSLGKTKPRNESCSAIVEKKPKSRQLLFQNDFKSKNERLTYVERHQLENGYNPLYLRQGRKKVTSETTRSNYGDSATGGLSTVSSRTLRVDDEGNSEDEERFYKEIINKEKRTAAKTGLGKTESLPLQVNPHGRGSESEFPKEVDKLQRTRVSVRKNFLKPIDIKSESKREDKKSPHYCVVKPSSQITKTELALKGKAYGFLANARNILKFKSKEKKLTGFENFCLREVYDLSDEVKPTPRFSSLRKRKSALEGDVGQLLSEGALGSGKDDAVDPRENQFYLPRVSTSEHGFSQANLENIMRISLLLQSEDYENERRFTARYGK